jgi:ABC-2 type transport system permease protein
VPPLIYLFVWSTAAGGATAGGMTRDEFVGYYLLLIVVNQLTYAQANWTVGDGIRSGRFNVLLLRPLPPIFDALASEAAGKAVYLALVVPVVAVLAFLLKPELHPGLPGALAFLPALALAWALRFLWGYWLALLAFWAARADGLLALQDALVFLLGGVVAPVALLPGVLHSLALVLPFRYMIGFPVDLLATPMTAAQVGLGLLAQLGWLAITIALTVLVWRLGLRRYEAVGG